MGIGYWVLDAGKNGIGQRELRAECGMRNAEKENIEYRMPNGEGKALIRTE